GAPGWLSPGRSWPPGGPAANAADFARHRLQCGELLSAAPSGGALAGVAGRPGLADSYAGRVQCRAHPRIAAARVLPASDGACLRWGADAARRRTALPPGWHSTVHAR